METHGTQVAAVISCGPTSGAHHGRSTKATQKGERSYVQTRSCLIVAVRQAHGSRLEPCTRASVFEEADKQSLLLIPKVLYVQLLPPNLVPSGYDVQAAALWGGVAVVGAVFLVQVSTGCACLHLLAQLACGTAGNLAKAVRSVAPARV